MWGEDGMNNTEAISRIEQLAQDGSLVWASCRPAMTGGGWAVKIISPLGLDRMGRGPTLGEALADALRGLETEPCAVIKPASQEHRDVRADVDLAHSIGLEF